MPFVLSAALLAASAVAAPLPACRASIGERPSVLGVTVADLPDLEGVYRKLRVTAARGAHLDILYDPGSEAAARSRAACLGAQMTMLVAATGDERRDAEWASVVFTQDAAYTPARRQGLKARWKVLVAPDGSLSDEAQSTVLALVPHEQVHDFQARAGARTPRWFTEGHANWVGDRITGRLDPELLATKQRTRRAELGAATAPLTLAAWGSVRPKREAIMRQVSPEDRARMQKDPSFNPGGTFTFTQQDFIGDESNMPARYAAATAVFEGLERRHGTAKVDAFAREATATGGMVAPARMGELVAIHFGTTLAALLADPPRPPVR